MIWEVAGWCLFIALAILGLVIVINVLVQGIADEWNVIEYQPKHKKDH